VLIESVTRSTVKFNLLMVNRLINGGVSEIDSQALLSVLASVASDPAALSSARKSAQRFIEYQHNQRNTDA
jgi:hypothetical protein